MAKAQIFLKQFDEALLTVESLFKVKGLSKEMLESIREVGELMEKKGQYFLAMKIYQMTE